MRWFTADLHFGHANIISYSNRPFSDVEEMNEGLIARWNDVVAPDDEVWVLGDVSLSVKAMEDNIVHLNGRLNLVAGNHDKCWDGFKKGGAKYKKVYLDAGFERVITEGIYGPFPLEDGRRVLLSHLPYAGDSHDGDRFEPWRPKDKGMINICGHVHEKWTTQGRSINVGVDAPTRNWYPVPEWKLIQQIESL